MQAIPQDAVDLESFGNGDIVVGVAGVPQDLVLGVICPLTPMPPPSSVLFFADEDDVEGQDIEVVLTDTSLSLADASLSLAYQCVLVCFLLMLGSHLHILTLLTTQVALLFVLVWAVSALTLVHGHFSRNVVLLVTNSTAMLCCFVLYPAIYEKINMCRPLNFPKVFCGLKAFSGQNVKNGFETP